jgi:hypothetical protein
MQVLCAGGSCMDRTVTLVGFIIINEDYCGVICYTLILQVGGPVVDELVCLEWTLHESCQEDSASCIYRSHSNRLYYLI